jgi:Putative DNA-binding domain
MTLMSVPIDSITEDHLRSLIDNQVAELRIIEYKRELPGTSHEEKREFLADVCSFANMAGGDLVYGMTENGGMPRELPGFETSDIDSEILQLENSIRDGIGPRILGVRSFPLPLRSGRHALVLRVPRSFSRPHVVTFRGHWRFYSRSSAGKYPMDVGEVRRAFVLSESVADRIRAFRAERLSRVVAGETPVSIEGPSRIVLHVVPISAFDSPSSGVNLDIRQPPLGERVLLPIYIVNEVGLDESLSLYPSAFQPRYNFDGVFCDARLGTPGEGPEGYAQLFRTGIIEAADNDAFVDGYIKGYELDEVLVKAVDKYFRLLRELGIESPVFLLLSLVGVGDYRMLQQGGPLQFYSELRPVDRDDLLVPEVMVESLEQDLHALQQRMRPLLDAVWNAVGLPRSPHYDESGNWQSRR